MTDKERYTVTVEKTIPDDFKPYHDLAMAVVLQAIEDYKELLDTKQHYISKKGPVYSLAEIEKFFKHGAQNMLVLTDMSAKSMLHKLKRLRREAGID